MVHLSVMIVQELFDASRWPPLRGDYVVCDPQRPVAVVTLASRIGPQGAAIYGPCKTENLGVEKVVANIISNPNIRFLLICGQESKGHLPGDAILALHRNGIDGAGKITGARGAIPFIENIPPEAISRFQRQVELVDRIGMEDISEIEDLVQALSLKSEPYPEPPFMVVKKRHARKEVHVRGGDVIFGSGTVLDSGAWTVAEPGAQEQSDEGA
jgi:tetrahydromethanopterin S-methyltransferase subunit A